VDASTASRTSSAEAIWTQLGTHSDNLDASGRELLGRVPIVLGTASAATRLGDTVRPLAPYQEFAL
jgi:hypothetical protein